MTSMKSIRIALARSGDQVDGVDFGLFAGNLPGNRLLEREVTAARVQAHFAPWLPGEGDAWPLPHILALKFALRPLPPGDGRGEGSPANPLEGCR